MLRYLLVLTAVLPPATQQPAQPPPAELARKVDAFVERAFALGLTPAMGVAIVVDGRTVYSRAFGMADLEMRIPASDETLWYVASTSKSFAGFGVALLEAAGALDLSAPITRTVPAARWHAGVKPEELTLLDFLTHTHGLEGNGPLVLAAAFTGAVPEARWPELLQYHAPRESRDLAYSNVGYNVAAMAIDEARPEGWKVYLDRAVFQPAGMHNTFATVSGIDASRIAKPHDFTAGGAFETRPFEKRDLTMNAAGGHVATLGDLARWVAVHMNGGTIDGRRVFPESAVRRSHERLAARDARFAMFERQGWGLGWDVGMYQGDRMISRFGSYASYRSHVSFLPDRRVGVVVQVNGAPAGALTDVIAAYVYDLAAGRPDADERANAVLAGAGAATERMKDAIRQDRERRAARPQTLPRPLTDYAGAFEHPATGRMEWRAEGGRLKLRWGVLEPDVEVFDAAAGRIRVQLPGTGDVVEFVFEGTAPATAVRYRGFTLARR